MFFNLSLDYISLTFLIKIYAYDIPYITLSLCLTCTIAQSFSNWNGFFETFLVCFTDYHTIHIFSGMIIKAFDHA